MKNNPILLLILTFMLTGCDSGIEHDRAKALGQWRDWDKPTDSRELEAYTFAHNLKLPDSLPKPMPFDFKAHEQSSWISYIPEYIKNKPFLFITLSDFWGDYRNHVRQIERVNYFNHLCQTEAGETIFKTVDKVEGLYQMRPMPKRTTALMHDRYGFEDPADWSMREADGSPTLFIGAPDNGFIYFESPRHPKDSVNEVNFKRWVVKTWDKPEPPLYWKFHDYDGYTGKGMTADPEETITAHYGYTWRGIRRDRDREFGIAGGELMVLDLQTNEVLAVRRSFAIAKVYEGGTKLDWEFAYYCPGSLDYVSRKKREVTKIVYPFDFIRQVLNPINFDTSKIHRH